MKTPKLAYVSGWPQRGYTLQLRQYTPDIDQKSARRLTARAEYSQLDGLEFSTFRTAQNIANAINAYAEGR